MEFADHHAIQNIIYRYAQLNDLGDYEAVGKLFTHAKLYLPGQSEPAAVGAEQFTALWQKWNRIYPETGTPRTRHVTTNLLIEFDGPTKAHSQSYYTIFQATPSFPMQSVVGGAYNDKFEKIDGIWHLVERREVTDLFGDLSHHLAIPYNESDTKPNSGIKY